MIPSRAATYDGDLRELLSSLGKCTQEYIPEVVMTELVGSPDPRGVSHIFRAAMNDKITNI